jgi:uncharacterized protein
MIAGDTPMMRPRSFLRRRPATIFFLLTYAISWLGALAVAAPHLLRGERLPKFAGLMMFPVMLLGPSVAGLLLTAVLDGKAGLRELWLPMTRVRFAPPWYATLLLPPVLILSLLWFLKTTVSPVYGPSRFWLGVAFGVPAGLLEEIGWMGFAFPKLLAERSAVAAASLLGILWSAWHLPVIDFLGVATPHGTYWAPFALAFALMMTAMRIVIAWTFQNTHSVLLAQLMHISSTGSLVVFGAFRVNARQETIWYAAYGVMLWIVVGIVVWVFGPNLRANSENSHAAGASE